MIEAHYLFGPSYDNIEIIIHPQSIIHSMVETSDSSVIGQVSLPGLKFAQQCPIECQALVVHEDSFHITSM